MNTSPVEIAALDAFWASEMPEQDAFFEDLAMPLKPLDLSAALAATSSADEDAWLFGDKAAFAVRDIRVTSEPAVKAEQQDEEDATSVLLEPIMGSPVDELDAMASFMVDDVDPFQEVVVTSDDEPMSPSANAKSARARQYCSATEEKKLEKLRSIVVRLEKMYYARCHGRAASDSDAGDSDIDILRVKTIRSIERLQRVASDVAQENYGFRANKMPQRAREELFLHEMGGVLKGPLVREQLCAAIADKICSDAIVNTARSSAEAAMGLSTATGETLMGWDCRKSVDEAAGVLTYTTKKEYSDKPEGDFERVTSNSWQLLLASEQFATFMKQGSRKTKRSHVLKRLSDDAILIAFDTVVSRGENAAVEIHRDVCVAFRVRTSNGVMVGVSSVSPSIFESSVHPFNSISYVDNGMRWMQFSQASATSFSVTAGGHTQCASREAADSANVEALSLVLQWEREYVSPVFSL